MNLTAAVCAACGVLVGVYAVKRARLRDVLFSALTGIAALFAADAALGFTELNLPVNAFTVACAAAGGLPGAILVTLLNAFPP